MGMRGVWCGVMYGACIIVHTYPYILSVWTEYRYRTMGCNETSPGRSLHQYGSKDQADVDVRLMINSALSMLDVTID